MLHLLACHRGLTLDLGCGAASLLSRRSGSDKDGPIRSFEATACAAMQRHRSGHASARTSNSSRLSAPIPTTSTTARSLGSTTAPRAGSRPSRPAASKACRSSLPTPAPVKAESASSCATSAASPTSSNGSWPTRKGAKSRRPPA